MKKKPSFNFEKTLNQLHNIVNELEKGDIQLETSLKHFEEGIILTRQCQDALKEAEQKVAILLENSKEANLEDFYRENNEGEDPLTHE